MNNIEKPSEGLKYAANDASCLFRYDYAAAEKEQQETPQDEDRRQETLPHPAPPENPGDNGDEKDKDDRTPTIEPSIFHRVA